MLLAGLRTKTRSANYSLTPTTTTMPSHGNRVRRTSSASPRSQKNKSTPAPAHLPIDRLLEGLVMREHENAHVVDALPAASVVEVAPLLKTFPAALAQRCRWFAVSRAVAHLTSATVKQRVGTSDHAEFEKAARAVEPINVLYGGAQTEEAHVGTPGDREGHCACRSFSESAKSSGAPGRHHFREETTIKARRRRRRGSKRSARVVNRYSNY